MSSDSKPQAKYEVGQYFFQKEKRKLFKIVNAQWQGIIQKESKSKVKEITREINDWLYDIEYVSQNIKQEYGRYYEERLSKECTLVQDQVTPRTIYE